MRRNAVFTPMREATLRSRRGRSHVVVCVEGTAAAGMLTGMARPTPLFGVNLNRAARAVVVNELARYRIARESAGDAFEMLRNAQTASACSELRRVLRDQLRTGGGSSRPYFRIRTYSCVRESPSRRAARDLFHRISCRTRAMVSRSTVPRSVVDTQDADGKDWLAAESARWSECMSPPSARIAARSSAFRSSRTFPGQVCAISASRAAFVRPAGGRPNDLPISRRNASL